MMRIAIECDYPSEWDDAEQLRLQMMYDGYGEHDVYVTVCGE